MTLSLQTRLTHALDDLIGDDDVPAKFHDKYLDLLHEGLAEIETEEKSLTESINAPQSRQTVSPMNLLNTQLDEAMRALQAAKWHSEWIIAKSCALEVARLCNLLLLEVKMEEHL